MTTVQIRLPFPVSVNNMFPTNGKRRIPSPQYTAWKDQVLLEMMVQKPRRIAGQVRIRIDLVAPDHRLRDIDNLSKGVLDALVRHCVIESDDQHTVKSLSSEWQDEGSPCLVTITSVSATAL